jgi:2-amino-4-hydroxy-6-hydroxymethyldihydropteridine diphosphokinase
MVYEASIYYSSKLKPKLLVIGLGSNLGNRKLNLQNGIIQLQNDIGILLGKSLIYETEPFGVDHETSFLNQVVAFSTDLNPLEILLRCQKVEIQSGRKTKRDLAPRIIDIDILILGSEIFENEDLQIPHPAIIKRKFVLVPLAEILPAFIIPNQNRTVLNLLKDLENDSAWVKKYIT